MERNIGKLRKMLVNIKEQDRILNKKWTQTSILIGLTSFIITSGIIILIIWLAITRSARKKSS